MDETCTTTLSVNETNRLSFCCNKIEVFCESFHDAGLALKEIHDKRLYRDGCTSFEQFVQTRFGFRSLYARRLIAAAVTMTQLSGECQYLPANERVCRALNKLPEEQRVPIWKRLSEKSAKTGAVVDSGLVDEALHKLMDQNGKPKPKKKTTVVKETPATAVDVTPRPPVAQSSPTSQVLGELETATAQPKPEDTMEIAAKTTYEVLHIVVPKVLGYSLRIDRFLRGTGKDGIDTELIDNCMAQVHAQLELAERRCRS